MKTISQSATFVYSENQELVGFIIRDEKTGHNLVYSCSKMTIDEIARLIDKPEKKVQ